MDTVYGEYAEFTMTLPIDDSAHNGCRSAGGRRSHLSDQRLSAPCNAQGFPHSFLSIR